MKKKLLSVLLVAVLVVSMLSGALTAQAKTDLSGSAVDAVLFYVKNGAGEDVLISQNPVEDMAAAIDSGELDDTVYNYSLLDRMVTTVHQEAQGFTVADFIEYAQENSTLPVLAGLPLTFAGDDKVGFWEIDDAVGYNSENAGNADVYTWNELYGVARYNYPLLYEYWNYNTQQITDINAIKADAEPAQARLAVTAFSQRYISTDDISGYNMENLWSTGGWMDSERALRLMLPMTEANLENREATASNSRSCIWAVRLEMQTAPALEALGGVAAPTGYLTEDADNYYVHFSCATPGTAIYYNSNYDAATNMPTSLYDAAAPIAIPKTDASVASGTLSIKAHAVKDGYTDAGSVTLSLTVGAPSPITAWDDSTADVSWYDATDTAFTISAPAELAGLATLVNGGEDFTGKTVTLSSDLDLGGHEWTPIGRASISITEGNANYTQDKAFNGAFDGAGHDINGLSISGSGNGVALFGCVGENGSLSDFTMRGSVSGGYYVAGAAAICGGDLDGITNHATVYAANDCVGGVAAEGFGALSITDCHNRASIENASNTRSSGRVAGIIGCVDIGSTAVVSRCSNSGDVTGYQYVAGIVGGQFGNVDVRYCYNSGTITGVSFGKVYLGGVSGKLGGGTIDSCYNTGDLVNTHWMAGHIRAIGGIAGCEEGRESGSTAISNCYTTGSITVNTSNMEYGTHWIYEVANISGGNSTTSNNTMSYLNCYYLAGRIAIADSDNEAYRLWADVYKADPLIWDTDDIVSKTESEMQDADFVTALGGSFEADDDNVNDGYPVLYWQVGAEVSENEYAITTTSFGSESAVVSADKASSLGGQTVTVTVSNIESGKRLKTIEAKDASGGSVELTAVSEGVYSFTMPRRAVSVNAIFENEVSGSAQSYNVGLPAGLDAIWTLSVDSTYGEGNSIKAGATVFLTVEKAKEAAMTSLEGMTITCGDSPVAYETYSFSRDTGASGWRGVYVFTMPEGGVTVSPLIEYADFTVYSQESGGEAETVKTYTRSQMLDVSASNIYYSGCYDESMFFIGKAEKAVSLTALLSDAGLSMSLGDRIKVTAADGMDVYYTYEKLYGEDRYYYPNILSGTTAAEKAAGSTPVDAMLVISGNTQVGAEDAPIEQKICDTLNAYRFVYGQTEEQFNNGVPAVEHKVITDFPKYCASITLIKAEPDATWDWDDEGHYDISWYDRSATEFHLDTAEELAGFAWIVNQGDELQLASETTAQQEVFTGKTIYLDADIYLNELDVSGSSTTVRDYDAHQWPTIAGGTSTSEQNAVFDGTFDGQGHTIYNMYIFDLSDYTLYNARNRALFGVTAEAAVIKNVTIEDGLVRGARNLGAIVGKTGSLSGAYDATRVGHGSTIENCHNVNTTVYGTDGAGGCGGVVAAAWNYSIVRNCSNSGSVTNTGVYPAGGIAGKNEYIIEGCVNTGAVYSASGNAGGIAAINVMSVSVIENCVSSGSVTGQYSGGITGFNCGSIKSSYSVGTVSGSSAAAYVGGVVGEEKSSQTSSAVYWLDTAAASGVGLVTGGTDSAVSKTSGELKSAAFLTLLGSGWKADSMASPVNGGYPVPSWVSLCSFGDVNGDGKINAKDSIMIAQYSIRTRAFTDEQLHYADLNGDGKVNAKDSILLAQYQVGIITEFPVEKQL